MATHLENVEEKYGLKFGKCGFSTEITSYINSL